MVSFLKWNKEWNIWRGMIAALFSDAEKIVEILLGGREDLLFCNTKEDT